MDALDDLQEKFPLDSAVMIADATRLSLVNPYGLTGCVTNHDVADGVCVSLFISRIYRPCFWFNWAVLKAVPVPEVWKPVSPLAIETMIGGRTYSLMEPPVLSDSLMSIGLLRSWLHTMAARAANEALEVAIAETTFQELLTIYGDPSNAEYVNWMNANDKRVRRPMMTGAESQSTSFNTNISIPRPRIGG